MITGYAQVTVNVIYTLASVPMALKYLDKEQFGLWALVTQITSYLILIEFGLSDSICRHLSDHKDDKSSQAYANTIRTGTWVFSIQGLILIALTGAIALPFTSLLAIPAQLTSDFVTLLCCHAFIAALHLASRPHGAILWSHQRHDIINALGICSLLISYAGLWLGFILGWGLYSTVFAGFCSFLISIILSVLANIRLNYYPARGITGRFSIKQFKQLFGFGGELFIMNLGLQATNASRMAIISRFMGLEAASNWAIASKASSLAQSLTWRIYDTSAPGLAEMETRRENIKLNDRYRDVTQFSCFFSLLACCGLAVVFEPLLSIWTSGKITWNSHNNLLLGLLVVSTTISRCYTGVSSIKKNIGGMKYACLLEAICFITLAIFLTKLYGYTGMLISALICNTTICLGYGILRSKRILHLENSFTSSYILKITSSMFLITGIHYATLYFNLSNHGDIMHAVVGILITLATAPVIWILTIHRYLRKEIKNKIFNKFGLLRYR